MLKIKLKYSDEERIILLVLASLSYNMITLFINTIVNFILPNTPLDTLFCMGVYACIIIFALQPIIRRLKISDVIVFLAIILIFLLNYFLLPDTRIYISTNAFRFFSKALPFYFIGRCVRDYELFIKWASKLSRVMIPLGLVFYIITNVFSVAIPDDNMSFSYYYLPFILIEVYQLFNRFSKLDLILFCMSLLVILLSGTRGPILCLLVYVIIYIYLLEKKRSLKLLGITISGVFALFVMFGGITDLLILFNEQLNKVGWNSRIIESIINNELFNGSGRNLIYEKVLRAIRDNPVIGYGLYGDRIFLNGSYSHNIILELTVSFGFVGIISAITIILKPLIKMCNKNYDLFYRLALLLFFCTSVVKLMISGTLMNDAHLFLLLGILFQNRKGLEIDIESTI